MERRAHRSHVHTLRVAHAVRDKIPAAFAAAFEFRARGRNLERRASRRRLFLSRHRAAVARWALRFGQCERVTRSAAGDLRAGPLRAVLSARELVAAAVERKSAGAHEARLRAARHAPEERAAPAVGADAHFVRAHLLPGKNAHADRAVAETDYQQLDRNDTRDEDTIDYCTISLSLERATLLPIHIRIYVPRDCVSTVCTRHISTQQCC